MKIDKKFNTLSKSEYLHYIDNHKKYTDFNTLGLYRSISENEKLSLADKLAIRDYAHQYFQKTFDFLQLKDPQTYFNMSTLGQELTLAETRQFFDQVRRNQEKILKEKKIKHRNFGTYGKHDCGYEHCPLNGIMVKQGSFLCEAQMHFGSDKNKFNAKEKSKRVKKQRKQQQRMIRNEWEDELDFE